MAFIKRIALFLVLNFLVVMMISLVLSLLNIRPFLSEYGMQYSDLLYFCLIWGMGGALISLGLSRIMAKWAMGVKVIDSATATLEEQQLLHSVHALADQAGIPRPQVGIYRSNEVNAFATGPTQSRSIVAVSSGLLQRMKENELRGVLAHEISHIANGDMVTMALLQGVVNAFVMFLARTLAYFFSGIGKGRQNQAGSNQVGYFLFVYLFEIVFMILGSILIAGYSRWREFGADAGGARLAGKENMIDALSALRILQEVRDPQAEKPAYAAFKISSPPKKSLSHFFATHPPLQERIERLRGYTDLC